MSKLIGKITILAVFLSLAAAPLRSQAQNTNSTSSTNKPKSKATSPEAKAKPTAFTGKLAAVDGTAKTITLDDKAKRMFQITSETKLMKNGTPATLGDAAVGDEVHGTYKKTADGKMTALTVNFGATKAPPASGGSKKGTNSVSGSKN